MSSNVSFALNLQSDGGQKAIMGRLESELRVLENLRKFLNCQIKAAKDYAASLENASQNTLKSLNHIPTIGGGGDVNGSLLSLSTENTPNNSNSESIVNRACFHILGEVAQVKESIRTNAEFLQGTTLFKLNELITEKKSLLKMASDYYSKIKGKLDQFEEMVSKAKMEYMRGFEAYESARTKYENSCTKGKGLRTPEARDKFLRTRRRLNVAHSDYVITIQEAENYDRDFRTILLPGLLQIEQTWCEKEIVQWREILEQIYAKSTGGKGKLKEFEWSKEYLALISKHKCQPLQPKNFKFEPVTLANVPISQQALIVDSGTIEFLKGRVTLIDRRYKSSEKGLQERNEEMSEMGSTMLGDMKRYDISNLRCEVERLRSLKSLIDSSIKGKLSQSSIQLETISLKNEDYSEGGAPTTTRKRYSSSAAKLANFFRGRGKKGASPSGDSSGSQEGAHPTPDSKTSSSGSITSAIGGSNPPNKGLDKSYDFFHGVLPREDVVRLLRVDGDYLVRETMKNDESQIVLSVYWKGPKHFIVQMTPEGEFRFEAVSFPTVKELLDHYVRAKIPVTNRSGAIIKRPVKRERWELNNDDVKLIEKIGRGNFGDVYKASFQGQLVAVKTCKVSLPEEQKKKFLQEGRILKQYDHPNIVKLIGICVQKQPIMIVMELVEGGSLLTYLKGKGTSLTVTQMTKICLDAAAGMKYLEGKNCIHRDLAARNCLIDDQIIVKISDFGMSREEHEYIVSDGMKQIPIKWSAPEALNYGKYTSLSDVWSFGILMWEIFSRGSCPYPGMTNSKAREMVEDGYRMPIVEGQPDVIYQLMTRCWMYDPEQRPRFSEIHSEIEVLLNSDLI